MAKNNLTPEKRLDRNGNLVTRWVRSAFGTKGIEREMPRVDNTEYTVTETLDEQIKRQLQAKDDLFKATLELEFITGASQCVEAYLGEGNKQPLDGKSMEAYRSFHELASSLGLATRKAMYRGMQRMAGHVIVFPEDGPALENMVRRGITDSDTALQVLAETKEKNIPTALSDGFI
jgi:hypothetical protein